MKIFIPASVTYSYYPTRTSHNSPSGSKLFYKTSLKRIVLRISTGKFGAKVSKLNADKRQVSATFLKSNQNWIIKINRLKKANLTITTHTRDPKHIWLQIVLNRISPNEFLEEFDLVNTYGSKTIPVKVELDIDEWSEVQLTPSDFLYHTEKYPKLLMDFALNNGFSVSYVPKGRECDLQLISPKGKKFIIGVLSHNAKTPSRSKQHRVQKALIDIAKMLPSTYNSKDLVPVIVTQPFQFDGSWNFASNNYLDFYEKNFNFKFIFTNFRERWEKEVCDKLKGIS